MTQRVKAACTCRVGWVVTQLAESCGTGSGWVGL
jgi:hypothetical protein